MVAVEEGLLCRRLEPHLMPGWMAGRRESELTECGGDWLAAQGPSPVGLGPGPDWACTTQGVAQVWPKPARPGACGGIGGFGGGESVPAPAAVARRPEAVAQPQGLAVEPPGAARRALPELAGAP
eukprot:scaffold89432_cov67-Phaeocystis_antarctica.AAC.3